MDMLVNTAMQTLQIMIDYHEVYATLTGNWKTWVRLTKAASLDEVGPGAYATSDPWKFN